LLQNPYLQIYARVTGSRRWKVTCLYLGLYFIFIIYGTGKCVF